MSDEREREELEELLKTPGWRRLVDYARRTWAGDGYAQKLKLAINDAKAAGTNVAEAVERVDASNEAINAVLSWPAGRVQALERQETRRSLPFLNRRGSA